MIYPFIQRMFSSFLLLQKIFLYFSILQTGNFCVNIFKSQFIAVKQKVLYNIFSANCSPKFFQEFMLLLQLDFDHNRKKIKEDILRQKLSRK